MKKISFLFPLLFFLVCKSTAQSQAEAAISAGIELHDKGDYAGAVAKYDEALKLEPSNYKAMYEKSLSLMMMKDYQPAEELLNKVIKECKEEDHRRLSYISLGTIYDYQGNTKKSIDTYNKGLKEFPDSYLLHYNKGVTLSGMSKTEEAIGSFQSSAQANPMHASSHNALGRLTMDNNRIPAIMAFFTFLLVEPESERAAQNLNSLNQLIMKGISENETGGMNILVDAGMLDKKKKKNAEDDFSTADMMLSLLAATSKQAEDSLGLKTEADKLSYKLQMLTNLITEREKQPKGFFKNFYVPMLAEMKEKNYMQTACYIAMTSSRDEAIKKWLAENESRINELYEWFDAYTWTKKE